MLSCFSFARCVGKIKATGKHAAGEAKCEARAGPAGHKTQDRIPQSQSSVTAGQGGEGSALPKEASSKFPAWVRLSYIFLLRNMRKSGQEWEIQECKGNSRGVTAHDKERRRRGWSVRRSICLSVKGTGPLNFQVPKGFRLGSNNRAREAWRTR